MFGSPSISSVFVQSLFRYVPLPLLNFVLDHSSRPGIQRARDTATLATGVAKELVREKRQALAVGTGKRDVMSLLRMSIKWLLQVHAQY